MNKPATEKPQGKRGRRAKPAGAQISKRPVRIMAQPAYKEMVDEFILSFSHVSLTVCSLFQLAMDEFLTRYAAAPAKAVPVIVRAEGSFPKYGGKTQGSPEESRRSVQIPLIFTEKMFLDSKAFLEAIVKVAEIHISFAEFCRAAVVEYIGKHPRKARAGQLGTLAASHVPVSGPIIPAKK